MDMTRAGAVTEAEFLKVCSGSTSVVSQTKDVANCSRPTFWVERQFVRLKLRQLARRSFVHLLIGDLCLQSPIARDGGDDLVTFATHVRLFDGRERRASLSRRCQVRFGR